MTSRILGLLRDQILAAYFGASSAMDAFNVAFKIPNLVRDLFAEGAMSAAFVPTFTRRLTLSGRERAWTLGTNVFNALLLVTGILVVLGIVFAEPLIRLIAGRFAAVPGKLELTIFLTRAMLPFLTLVALAAAMMGMLNSLHRFFVPALSPAMFNVGTIACALLLVPLMSQLGWQPITAIAIGTLVGGLGQVALQWPALHKEGFRYRPVLNLRDPDLSQILRLMGPGTIGLAATQVNLLVNTILATGQPGAVSWLNYAFRLMYLPIGLFGVSIATAAVPAISRHAAEENPAGMRATISSGLRLMLMLNMPATVGLIVLAAPIIELLFEYGAFSDRDTAATAAALMFYAPGLIGYSAVKIAVPSFYALGNSRTPVAVSIVTMAINVTINVTLVRFMGYRGLALGTAIAALLNAAILLVLLGRRLDGLDGGRLATAAAKISMASFVMGTGAWAVLMLLSISLPGDAAPLRLVRVLLTIGASLLLLAGAARALRVREFDEAMAAVMRKLRMKA